MQMSQHRTQTNDRTHAHSYMNIIYNIMYIHVYTCMYIVYIRTHKLSPRDLPRSHIARGEGKGPVGVRALLIDFKYLLRSYIRSNFFTRRTDKKKRKKKQNKTKTNIQLRTPKYPFRRRVSTNRVVRLS